MQRLDHCAAFIDLPEAFDTVNREMLWEIMRRARYPTKFTNIVRAFHNPMKATVSIGSKETTPFDLGVTVKQGYLMAPVIFNVFLAAASYLCRESFPPERGLDLT